MRIRSCTMASPSRSWLISSRASRYRSSNASRPSSSIRCSTFTSPGISFASVYIRVSSRQAAGSTGAASATAQRWTAASSRRPARVSSLPSRPRAERSSGSRASSCSKSLIWAGMSAAKTMPSLSSSPSRLRSFQRSGSGSITDLNSTNTASPASSNARFRCFIIVSSRRITSATRPSCTLARSSRPSSIRPRAARAASNSSFFVDSAIRPPVPGAPAPAQVGPAAGGCRGSALRRGRFKSMSRAFRKAVLRGTQSFRALGSGLHARSIARRGPSAAPVAALQAGRRKHGAIRTRADCAAGHLRAAG